MRLRLWHAPDGARVAYREGGTGPPIALLHSLGLSHRELEPVVEHLSFRYRVVLPDLPLHGDSEDRPRHPYTMDWLVEVMAAFVSEVCGPRAVVGGHGLGAELALNAVRSGRLAPERLIVLPNRMHGAPGRTGWRAVARAAGVPGLDRIISRAVPSGFRPRAAMGLTARRNPAAQDLLRHAVADVAGNTNLSRSWARFARGLSSGPDRDLLDDYQRLELPVLLLWADEDARHPLTIAEEALDLLPDAQLRILPRTGFLIAYDDPVGLAREIAAFA